MKLFYFISKTDPEIVKSCTQKTQDWQYAAGIWVMVSGLIAFFSSYIVILILSHNSIISMIISVIFALAIMVFSREIISMPDKKIVLLHIPYALIMGLVFSLPIEVYMLSVNAHDIIEMAQTVNDIKSSDTTAMAQMTLLRVAVVVLFLYPAFRRLYRHNEYLEYIHYRMALNVQKIRAATNVFMNDIIMDPRGSLDKDYADILIHTVEDMADTGDNAEDENIIIPGVWMAPKSWQTK